MNSLDRSTCNPLEIWPTRTFKKLKVKKSKTKKGGWTDDSTASIPVENNAYARTVRMHEALHGLYTKRDILVSDSIAQAVEDARIHTLARTKGSAARDEMVTAIRDLRDVRKSPGKRIAVTLALRSGAILQKHNRSDLQPMIDAMAEVVGPHFASTVNRALSLLRDGDHWEEAERLIRGAVALDIPPKSPPPPPPPEDEDPKDGEKGEGRLIPSPTPTLDEIPSSSESAESDLDEESSDGPSDPDGESPLDVKGDESEDAGSKSAAGGSGSAEDSEDPEEEDFEDYNPFEDDAPAPSFPGATEMLKPKDVKKVIYSAPKLEEIPGALSAEAVEMLSESTLKEIEEAEDSGKLPRVNIVPIYKSDPIRAKVGSTVKHSVSGQRIDAKKLSLVVTPGEHRIFLKTQRSNGGTILIDASGSMKFTLQDLEGILLEAPVATIAFYNAHTDHYHEGNLWIFAYRGKRAPKIEGPGIPREQIGPAFKYYHDCYGRWPLKDDASVPDSKRWGCGNVIDFQVCQWLLAQPGPRYFVTDCKFIGSSCASNDAAQELTRNAVKAGKLKTVWSPKHKLDCRHTFELLRKMLAENRGRG